MTRVVHHVPASANQPMQDCFSNLPPVLSTSETGDGSGLFTDRALNRFSCSYVQSVLSRGGCRAICRKQLGHAFGELCSVTGPVLYPLTLQVDCGGIGARVVSTHYLDRPAIAGTILFNHNNSIIRLLPCTEASQTNHQHRRKSFQIFFPDGVKSGWAWGSE